MDDDTSLAGQPEAIDSTIPMNFVQMAQAWQSLSEVQHEREQWQALLLDRLQALLASETENTQLRHTVAQLHQAITAYLAALDADPFNLNTLIIRTQELREALKQ